MTYYSSEKEFTLEDARRGKMLASQPENNWQYERFTNDSY